MITIRTAEPSDVAQLAALLEELFAIEADFAFVRNKQIQGLKQLLASEKAALFVAESDRRVVGMCSLQTLISTAEGGPVGLVEDLIVTEAFRHQGIGEKLLALCCTRTGARLGIPSKEEHRTWLEQHRDIHV